MGDLLANHGNVFAVEISMAMHYRKNRHSIREDLVDQPVGVDEDFADGILAQLRNNPTDFRHPRNKGRTFNDLPNCALRVELRVQRNVLVDCAQVIACRTGPLYHDSISFRSSSVVTTWPSRTAACPWLTLSMTYNLYITSSMGASSGSEEIARMASSLTVIVNASG